MEKSKLNLKKIHETAPKAFEFFLKWSHSGRTAEDFFKMSDSPELRDRGINDRELFTFFDQQELYIEIDLCFNDVQMGWNWRVFWDMPKEEGQENLAPVKLAKSGSESDYHLQREDAECGAFEQAFEELEYKIVNGNFRKV